MSAVMEADTRSVTRSDGSTPSDLLEVINYHLIGHEGPPTPEIVKAICKDPAAVFRVSQVLRYFFVQSSLRPRDLGALCMGNGSAYAIQPCTEANAERVRLVAESDGRWRPRWEG